MKRSTKSLLSLLLSAAILACMLITPAFAVTKTNPIDIAGNAYQQDIIVLDGYGGLAGLVDQNGRFHPEDFCSVSDLAKIMQNLYPSIPVPSGFDTPGVISQKGATNLLTYYSSTLGYEVTWSNSSSAIPITRGDAAGFIVDMLDCSPELAKLINTGSNTPTIPTPSTPNVPGNPTIPTGKFQDVSPNAYYAMAVDWAVNYGVTAGTSATTFSPNDTCTVAQVLTFLYRANGAPKPSSKDKCPFTNIQSDSWAYNAIRWANSKDLISGDTNDPLTTPCTRAYLVDCLWKIAGKPRTSTSIKHFTDVPSNASYANAVKWALSRSITSGTSVNTFSPFDTITRGQAVTFLYRTYASS